MHVEYVRHVLGGGPGVCPDFAGAVLLLPHTIRQQVAMCRAHENGPSRQADVLTVGRPLSSGCDSQEAKLTTAVTLSGHGAVSRAPLSCGSFAEIAG
jgi:hypothetical protein